MRSNYCILTFLFFLFSVSVSAQDYHTRSNRALRFYLQGKSDLEMLFIDQAEHNFKLATKEDQGFYEAWLMLGQLYNDKEIWADGAQCLSHAIKIDSLFFIPALFSLGKAEARSGRYVSAKTHLISFISQDNQSSRLISEANELIKNCDFALSFSTLR